MNQCQFLVCAILIVISDFLAPVYLKEQRRRTRRSAYPAIFPSNGGTGVFIALAVPLDLVNENVFMSHSVESFYGNYDNATYLIPGIIKTWDISRNLKDAKPSKVIAKDANNLKSASSKNSITKRSPPRKKKANSGGYNQMKQSKTVSFMNRKSTYKMLKNKFSQYGYAGKSCLLRMICEAAMDPIGLHNGILGDLMHIILTPSSSKKEGIHQDYYLAEKMGNNKNCALYEEKCPKSVFDLCSKFVYSSI